MKLEEEFDQLLQRFNWLQYEFNRTRFVVGCLVAAFIILTVFLIGLVLTLSLTFAK